MLFPPPPPPPRTENSVIMPSPSRTHLNPLNSRFAIEGQLHFEPGPGGLCTARINNRLASAAITLQGAHILHYQPLGQAPLLWLSPWARYAPGQPIRGGIPICWPWFGAHPVDTAHPAHGLARVAAWQVKASAALPDGGTRLIFALEFPDDGCAAWPYPSHVEYRVTVGASLTLELMTENTGSGAFRYSEALHTYFAVSDLDNIRITGLNGAHYLDKTAAPGSGIAGAVQHGPILIDGEVDRLYLDTEAVCLLEDSGLHRRIEIAKQGGGSTVVWSPGDVKAASMGDLGQENYRSMVCVESANAAVNAITLQPGRRHSLHVQYHIAPL